MGVGGGCYAPLMALPRSLLPPTPSLRFLAPNSVADARFLSAVEKAALQAELGKQQSHPAALATPSDASPPLTAPASLPPRRTLAQDWVSLKLAASCRLVWYGGAVIFFHVFATYGLLFFTPLIIKATLTNKSTANSTIVLLSTIPYAAAVIFHACNGWHSQVRGGMAAVGKPGCAPPDPGARQGFLAAAGMDHPAWCSTRASDDYTFCCPGWLAVCFLRCCPL